jgi:tetratricopeptide (TPR) repeat protein
MTLAQEDDCLECLLDVWEQRIRDDPICARVLANLLISQPDLVHRIDSLQALRQCIGELLAAETPDADGPTIDMLLWPLALAQLHFISGRPIEAESYQQRAMDSIRSSRLGPDALCELADQLEHFLGGAGHEGLAGGVRRRLQIEILLAEDDENSLVTLREAAFESFLAADYADAERIYRHLLAHNFEPSGTYVHLARIMALTGREEEAAGAVEMAWQSRDEATPYIIARIHFLRALLATLAGADASAHLAAVTRMMDKPACHYSWTILPLLDLLRPRLGRESHALFTRVANALSQQ